MKIKNLFLWIVGGLLGAFVAFLLVVLNTNLLVTQFPPVEPAFYLEAKTKKEATSNPDSLLVMSWNVKFGGGRIDFFFDCYGDRVNMTQPEVEANLKGLAAKINQTNPDVLLLQEADWDADRSVHINQVQWLLDHTDMNYAVYASQWDAYVPSDGIGKVNSGNAILSKYPIKNAQRHALPLVASQPGHVRFFYLRRSILAADVLLGKDSLAVFATHLDAYAKDDTRLEQLNQLKGLMDDAKEKGRLIIAGGDLNTLPPGTKKTKNFDDSACKEDSSLVMDDYTREQNWLLPFYRDYREAIELPRYQQDETKFYSHTVNGRGYWNRRLDYLFTNAKWLESSGLVHQNETSGGMATMPLSDHAPITGKLILVKE